MPSPGQTVSVTGLVTSADINRWTNKVVFMKYIKAKEEKKERTGKGILEGYLYTNGSPYSPYSPEYGSQLI